MNQTLNLSLATTAADNSDYVLIEQEPWPKDVGRTSAAQGLMAIGAMAFGGTLPLPNCGGLNGFSAPVYVYPSRPDLNFIFAVSHGEIQPGSAATMIREEIIQCSLLDNIETQYPVTHMMSMQWLGNCFDENGSVIARPDVVQIGRVLSFSKKVYGSLRVRYSVFRKTFNVRIEAREDSIENNFECVAFARWNGGLEYKEIEAPSGYEATTGNCGNGLYPNGDGTFGGSTGTGDACQPTGKQGSYPKAVRADRKTEIEYCSQEVQSDSVTESVDTGSDPSDCENDEPIITN